MGHKSRAHAVYIPANSLIVSFGMGSKGHVRILFLRKRRRKIK
ncbi:hypothetical protein ROSINTL182_05803 [Roseburia intestinalis L1-82]|uniref:Uncharacterized protein n=1 Tax=Roseburia intestinalis L1-82 TaxID=536231 RepID=C7G7D6_9FIRM|nr:hypothetical protein ROSINTL182_05803 [Roseburia intestinalis L1-82]